MTRLRGEADLNAGLRPRANDRMLRRINVSHPRMIQHAGFPAPLTAFGRSTIAMRAPCHLSNIELSRSRAIDPGCEIADGITDLEAKP